MRKTAAFFGCVAVLSLSLSLSLSLPLSRSPLPISLFLSLSLSISLSLSLSFSLSLSISISLSLSLSLSLTHIMDEASPLLTPAPSALPGHVQSLDESKQALSTSVPPHGHASAVETFFNFAKASIGAGSFALPWAILQSGLVAGPVALVVIGVLSLYTMRLMLECKRAVNERQGPWTQAQTYADVGKSIVWWGAHAVNASVILCNLGVCSGYMIFIALNLRAAASTITGVDFGSMGIYALFLPILALLTWLPSFKLLARGAYLGTVFLCLAMAVVYAYGKEIDTWKGAHDFHFIRIESFPLFFGIAAFLFCVHSMVIPLESTMARPREMYAVLDLGCLVVLLVNLPFAIYGFLMFGEDTAGYVFCNLSKGVLLTVVQVALCLELMLTFPIVFFPATHIVEDYFLTQKTQLLELKRLMLRTALVALSWGLAVAIPVFELCLSLIGGLTGSTLAFVLPPLFHMILFRGSVAVPLWRKALHGLLILLGVTAIACTAQAVIVQIVDLYKSDSEHSSEGKNSTSC